MVRKVCVVVTARPSYSRIKTALRALEQPSGHRAPARGGGVGHHRALRQRRLGHGAKTASPSPRACTACLEGDTLVGAAKSTGIGMSELASVFEQLRPDIVVTVADRYETLATAAAAAYCNIPLAHIQGGEITGSIDEKVRHAVTKLADLHFVSTERARDYVIRMGEHPDRVFKTGCPSIDIAREVLENPRPGFDPLEQYGGVGPRLDLSQGYLVVMQHPVTTEIDETSQPYPRDGRGDQGLALPTIWFWPNVDAGSDAVSKMLRTEREHGALRARAFLSQHAARGFPLHAARLAMPGGQFLGGIARIRLSRRGRRSISAIASAFASAAAT